MYIGIAVKAMVSNTALVWLGKGLNFLFSGSSLTNSKLNLHLCFPNTSVTYVTSRIVLSNRQNISSLFRYKDDLPCALRSGVVYKYRCTQCASCYIGSTCRRLHTRISEHAGISLRTNILIFQPCQSSIETIAFPVIPMYKCTYF